MEPVVGMGRRNARGDVQRIHVLSAGAGERIRRLYALRDHPGLAAIFDHHPAKDTVGWAAIIDKNIDVRQVFRRVVSDYRADEQLTLSTEVVHASRIGFPWDGRVLELAACSYHGFPVRTCDPGHERRSGCTDGK